MPSGAFNFSRYCKNFLTNFINFLAVLGKRDKNKILKHTIITLCIKVTGGTKLDIYTASKIEEMCPCLKSPVL